jgi:hypothetical protein
VVVQFSAHASRLCATGSGKVQLWLPGSGVTVPQAEPPKAHRLVGRARCDSGLSGLCGASNIITQIMNPHHPDARPAICDQVRCRAGRRLARKNSSQSLAETALIIPELIRITGGAGTERSSTQSPWQLCWLSAQLKGEHLDWGECCTPVNAGHGHPRSAASAMPRAQAVKCRFIWTRPRPAGEYVSV